VVQKKIDQPPFIHQMTMTEPGDYTIQVSVTDNNGLESSSPKCEATRITVASTNKIVATTRIGNFVADAGYMYLVDPAEYLLFRVGYDYYLNDSFSILGMVGAAPVIGGNDDTDSFIVDITGVYRLQRTYYSAGVGIWNSSTDDRVDVIVNVGYRFYGQADQFNISAFVEGRGAFDQLDELADYGRIGAGLRFQF
jgi:opacity protein-like surface antigen